MADAVQNFITELNNHQQSLRSQPLISQVSIAVAALNEIEAGLVVPTTGVDGSVLSNISGVTGPLTANLLTLLFSHVFGSTVGSMLYYNSGLGWFGLNPGAAGTLLQSGGTGNNLSWSTLGQIAGTQTNDSANAGNIGEYISSIVVIGSAIALTSGNSTTVTSISLTAGDWDVAAGANFTLSGTTTFQTAAAGIASSGNNVPLTAPGVVAAIGGGASAIPDNTIALAVGPARFSLATTTTIFLSARADFGVSTMSAYGILRARRMR